MARILIQIGAHLSTAPRAQKEALALSRAGHDVHVAGVWFDPHAVAADLALARRTGLRFTPALDFRGGTWPQALRRLRTRLASRWARERFQHRRRLSPHLLGYGAPALLAHALRIRADLTLVHSEAGLWVADQLLRRGLRVGLDFEDWFSRDLAPADRAQRPVDWIESLESRVARAARCVFAPSRALAHALAEAYAIPPPTVIYNAVSPDEIGPGSTGRPDRSDPALPSLYWFSQTIGLHRGLEELIAALPLLHRPVRLHLRGTICPEVQHHFLRLVPASYRAWIRFLPLVPALELPARTAEHDIGLALELPTIPSRNLSVSNKLFHYLRAGLAVVATPTLGQTEVLGPCPEAGLVLDRLEPASIAAAINTYLAQPDLLARAKAASLRAGETFLWSEQEERLVKAVAAALADAPASSHRHGLQPVGAIA